MDLSTVQQLSNLQVTVTDQPRTLINTGIPVVPYDLMFPFLIPEIHPDKASELVDLFDKYKRDEISRHTIFRHMKDIVGEELLMLASAKVTEQKRNLQVTDQSGIQINSTKLEVPFDQLFSFLVPQIDQDRAIELQILADKSERGLISMYNFEPIMKGILGEQMVRSAAAKVLEQKSNIQVTVNEQTGTQINSSNLVVPFDQLYHFLMPQIEQHKAIELHTLADKYERGEIPKHTFVTLMEGIVGEQVLRSAVTKVQKKKSILLVEVNEQPRTQINSRKRVLRVDKLYRFLIPLIDQSKAIELHTLANKYERGEIPRHTFVSLLTDIVGEQVLRTTVAKMKEHVSRVDGLC